MSSGSRLAKSLLLAAVILVGVACTQAEAGLSELEELRQNVSALWTEVTALREEVSNHHHGGHPEADHDRIVMDVGVMQHEQHIHHDHTEEEANQIHPYHQLHHSHDALAHIDLDHDHDGSGAHPSQDEHDEHFFHTHQHHSHQSPSHGVHSHDSNAHSHDHGDHSHDDGDHSHANGDHSHDHGDHSHDSNAHSHDHGDHSHDDGDHSHDHGDHSHDHGDHSHDHGDHSHDHGDYSHDHGDRSHDHGDHSHDHGDHSHDHGDHSHDDDNNSHERDDSSHEHGDHGRKAVGRIHITDVQFGKLIYPNNAVDGHSHGHDDHHPRLGHDHGHEEDHGHHHNHDHGSENQGDNSGHHDNHHITHLSVSSPYHPRNQKDVAKATCDLRPNSAGAVNDVSGTVTITQKRDEEGPVYFDLSISGFVVTNPSGQKFGFHVHEAAVDSSGDCGTTGGHFNPHGVVHGGPTDEVRHTGDLGNIVVPPAGQIDGYVIVDHRVAFSGEDNIIGKSIVVHAGEDDLGKGGDEGSITTGNAGARLACCTIYLAPSPRFRFGG